MGREFARRAVWSRRGSAYKRDEQISFILRQVSQRHAVIFVLDIGADLTPTHWAALAKLGEDRTVLGRTSWPC